MHELLPASICLGAMSMVTYACSYLGSPLNLMLMQVTQANIADYPALGMTCQMTVCSFHCNPHGRGVAQPCCSLACTVSEACQACQWCVALR